jgi:hypothetical protein
MFIKQISTPKAARKYFSIGFIEKYRLTLKKAKSPAKFEQILCKKLSDQQKNYLLWQGLNSSDSDICLIALDHIVDTKNTDPVILEKCNQELSYYIENLTVFHGNRFQALAKKCFSYFQLWPTVYNKYLELFKEPLKSHWKGIHNFEIDDIEVFPTEDRDKLVMSLITDYHAILSWEELTKILQISPPGNEAVFWDKIKDIVEARWEIINYFCKQEKIIAELTKKQASGSADPLLMLKELSAKVLLQDIRYKYLRSFIHTIYDFKKNHLLPDIEILNLLCENAQEWIDTPDSDEFSAV